MQNWHRQFLGRTQMPPTLSAFVIGPVGAKLQFEAI
jgi:hypothetical protein